MVEPLLQLGVPGHRADQDAIGYSGWSLETASRPGSGVMFEVSIRIFQSSPSRSLTSIP
jgi:hypothetical protein